jgi:hypothetical protein
VVPGSRVFRYVQMTAPQNNPLPRVRFGQTSAAAGSGPGFGLGGAVAGVAIVAVILGGLAWSAASGRADSAKHPDLFGGSLVL